MDLFSRFFQKVQRNATLREGVPAGWTLRLEKRLFWDFYKVYFKESEAKITLSRGGGWYKVTLVKYKGSEE